MDFREPRDLGEAPDYREQADNRLIETGAFPAAFGVRGRSPVVMAKPPFRCFVCTRGIDNEGLCPRCTIDRDEQSRLAELAYWARIDAPEKD